MDKHKRFLDRWSQLVVVLTFVLFAVALFQKGFTHDLLLEAGVLLVSVKLMMMAYKNAVAAKELKERLVGIKSALERIEGVISAGVRSE